jgi:CRISPR-associated protein Csm3
MQNRGGKMNEYKFQGKYILKFDLRCVTGLHVGGITEGLEIGGLDNPVIKDPLTGYPYIPGSSLKGKLRCLLEWGLEKVYEENGKAEVHSCENLPEYKNFKEFLEKKGVDDEELKKTFSDLLKKANFENKKIENEFQNLKKRLNDKNRDTVVSDILREKLKLLISQCPICQIFGISASAEVGEPTRLTVRDIFPKSDTVTRWEEWLGEKLYTELKIENVIDRITSEANPRTMERVPADSVFEVEMIYDVYKERDVDNLKYIFQAMAFLEDSSLGGSGTRGYGKVKFENPRIVYRSTKEYYLKKDGTEKPIGLKKILKNNPDSIPKTLFNKFEEIEWKDKEDKV